jgi:hypothetical protein
MKRTGPMRSAVLLAPLLLAAVTAAAGDAQQGPALIDLSGPWMSTFGPVMLTQDGASIVGSFAEGSERVRNAYIRGKTIPADEWNAERGTITDGVVDAAGKTLIFKYHEAQSQLDGDVTLTLSSDGGTLEGPYTATGMGGTRNGTWTMWRNRCGSAKYLVAC